MGGKEQGKSTGEIFKYPTFFYLNGELKSFSKKKKSKVTLIWEKRRKLHKENNITQVWKKTVDQK